MQEPNLLRPWLGAVSTAEIEGVRTGSSVTFTKFYESGSFEHAVRYEGQVDGALTRIEGAWIIPGEWSGTFFMVRDDDGEAVEAEAAVEQDIRK